MIDEIPTKTLTNTSAHVEAWREYQHTKPLRDRVYCVRWDNAYAQPLIENGGLGQCIGILQPVEWSQ